MAKERIRTLLYERLNLVFVYVGKSNIQNIVGRGLKRCEEPVEEDRVEDACALKSLVIMSCNRDRFGVHL